MCAWLNSLTLHLTPHSGKPSDRQAHQDRRQRVLLPFRLSCRYSSRCRHGLIPPRLSQVGTLITNTHPSTPPPLARMYGRRCVRAAFAPHPAGPNAVLSACASVWRCSPAPLPCGESMLMRMVCACACVWCGVQRANRRATTGRNRGQCVQRDLLLEPRQSLGRNHLCWLRREEGGPGASSPFAGGVTGGSSGCAAAADDSHGVHTTVGILDPAWRDVRSAAVFNRRIRKYICLRTR